MADTQPLNATFFAFRKREGGLLLGAGIAYAVGLIVLVVLFYGAVWALLGRDFFSLFQQLTELGDKGGGAASASLPPNFARIFLIAPVGLVFLVLLFVLLASFESACLRWMIRGERSGPLNLCFGADMWRVYGTYWAWFLFFACTYILFLIVVFVVAFAAASVGRDNPVLVGLLIFAAVAAWVVGWIYVAVRLAPAAAASIGAGNFAPLKAWSVSRGRFWALFGSYLLLFVLYVIAAIVAGAIVLGWYYASVVAHIDWSAAQSNPSDFSRSYEQANLQAMRDVLASPLSIALFFGGQMALRIVSIVFAILLYGVNARAVQAALEEGKIAHEPAAA